MLRLSALCLALTLVACAEQTRQAASTPPSAVHYQLRHGTQLLSCVTSGYDTICRNA